jgi:hypothetical protein
LLDTDKLKEGTGTAENTDAGVDSSVDSSADSSVDSSADSSISDSAADSASDVVHDQVSDSADAADSTPVVTCTSSQQCETDQDPCTHDICNKDADAGSGICVRDSWLGKPAIFSKSSAVNELTADQMGVPVIFSDGTNFHVAVWYTLGTEQNVQFVTYKIANPSITASKSLLSSLASVANSGIMDGYLATPGGFYDSTKGYLELIVAAKPSQVGKQTGLYRITLNSNNFSTAPTTQSHSGFFYAGWDAASDRTYPRQFSLWNNSIVAAWPLGKGFVNCIDDQCTAKSLNGVLSNIAVSDVIPLQSELSTATKEGVVLESTSSGSETTSIWSLDSISASTLVGSGTRFGISAAPISAATDPTSKNIVLWSTNDASGPKTFIGGVSCDANACTSFDLAQGASAVIAPAVYPFIQTATGLSSIDTPSFPKVRAITMQMSATTADDGKGNATSVLMLGGAVSNIKEEQKPWAPMSPDSVLVTSAVHESKESVGSVIGRSASAIAPDGSLLIAWVQRDPATNKSSLYTRRFLIDKCTH